MFLVVADEILQREAIVCRDEIDTGVGFAAAGFVKIGRAGKAPGEVADQPPIALPIRSHGVAVFVIPFVPARGKVTHLVAAAAQIPGLCDQFDLRQQGVLPNGVEERSEAIHIEQFAGQGRGQVETKPVDVHLLYPVSEAVHQQLQNPRMLEVQRVSGSREVHVEPWVIGHQSVVGSVVQPAETQRRTHLIAFGCVVVDHVEDYLDSSRVERLHHRLEFADSSRRGVTQFRREEADTVIAPVVLQSFFGQVVIIHEGMHRHQLESRDP